MPCIGQSVTFDFCDAYLLHSNLGGQGPDASAPESIRYVNVARVTDEEGSVMHFDLELTATSGYRPFNSSRNGLHGCFANVNLDCNEDVELTVTMRRSCATARSCKPCIDPALSAEQRISCFAAGCACYGKTVYNEPDCYGDAPTTTCAFPADASKYSIITLGDANIKAHAVYGEVAVGGRFIDGTNNQDGTVCSNPNHWRLQQLLIVGEIFPSNAKWNFQGPGYTLDALPSGTIGTASLA